MCPGPDKVPAALFSAVALTPAWRFSIVFALYLGHLYPLSNFPNPKQGKAVQSNQEFYAHQMPFHNLYLYTKKTPSLKTSNSLLSW